MNKLIILLLSIGLIGCGGGALNMTVEECTDMYSQEFCDSITGEQGPQGEEGENGQTGLDGENGRDGSNGINGVDGDNCYITDVDGGAIVTCGMESVFIADGQDGEDGLNGSNGQDAVIEVIDPCGQESDYDEVLWRLNNNEVYAVYSDGTKIHLVMLIDGVYLTTDGTNCKFEVVDGDVIW